jgi:hypothetical protein
MSNREPVAALELSARVEEEFTACTIELNDDELKQVCGGVVSLAYATSAHALMAFSADC